MEPFMQYLGPDINRYRDSEVRRAPAPLMGMAEAPVILAATKVTIAATPPSLAFRLVVDVDYGSECDRTSTGRRPVSCASGGDGSGVSPGEQGVRDPQDQCLEQVRRQFGEKSREEVSHGESIRGRGCGTSSPM
jgi:hypothetical protein